MTGPSQSGPPIVLTTDFGLSDAYVGVMKGVILGINPNAAIVDLTHDIGPQDLRHGAFVLGTNHAYFPRGAIHVAVVDPGVGTDRRPVILETPHAKFIAPDNGLLSEILKDFLVSANPVSPWAATIALPQTVSAYELGSARYRLNPVSNTFHGRDIFAPAAAYVSLGVSPAEMGPPIREMIYAPLPQAVTKAGRTEGEIVYVDRFGNLVSNIQQPGASPETVDLTGASVDIGSHRIDGISRTFHDISGATQPQADEVTLVALFGSNGYLEVAVPDGNAALLLGLGVGAPVTLSWDS